jgi:hypothetical protein
MVEVVIPFGTAVCLRQRGNDLLVTWCVILKPMYLREPMEEFALPMRKKQFNHASIPKFDERALLRIEGRVCPIGDGQHVCFNALIYASAATSLALKDAESQLIRLL